MIHYDGRLFRTLSASKNSETSSDTIFRYRQRDWVVTADYSGGNIEYGQLIGLVDEQGRLNLRYHHVNLGGHIMTGTCKSRPEVLPNGKIRLHERWKWTCGTMSKGTSIIEEI